MDWFAVFIINHMFQSNNLVISFSNLRENEKLLLKIKIWVFVTTKKKNF